MAKALYVGSFDPVTLGHMDIIKRACAMFDYVEVAVGDNPGKKYMFTFDERVKLMEDTLALIPGATGKVGLAHSPILTLTADHARMYGFDVIIKGARTNQDFDYEKLIHEVSATQQRDIETVLLFSSSKLGHVSSSAAKELAKFHGLIHEYVPIHVKAAIEAKMGQRIIGVTGVIGSGKSTFCRQTTGVAHINMDTLSHELLESKLPIAEQVRAKLMKQLGTCDRKELGAKVFGQHKLLQQLNDIFREPILTLLREKLVGKKGVIFLEGALLAEMNWLFLCNNNVILVKTPDEVEHKRRLKERGYTDEQIARRIASQYDEAGKAEAIRAQIKKDCFGGLSIFDTQNPNWNDAYSIFTLDKA